MKSNIALICLFNNYARNVSKALGDKLDMFYEHLIIFIILNLYYLLKQ